MSLVGLLIQALDFLVIGVGLVVFLVSPLSSVLNVITVPLGYEWQTCPHCLSVGLEKITYAECANCGERHARNWGAAKIRDGERIPFCTSECLDAWEPPAGDAGLQGGGANAA